MQSPVARQHTANFRFAYGRRTAVGAGLSKQATLLGVGVWHLHVRIGSL
jgi:hypothetical protein